MIPRVTGKLARHSDFVIRYVAQTFLSGLQTPTGFGGSPGTCAYLLTGACNCSITWSMVKLAAFCRGGYSLKVARNWPT